MSFASTAFVVFVPLVFSVYWLARSREQQNALVIAASYVFYSWWDYRFCVLILASSLVDFTIGLRLRATTRASTRQALLGCSLVANLGVLGAFKYLDFFADNFRALAHGVGWSVSDSTLQFVLPLGISFYTFQTLGYTIDVFRGRLTPTASLSDYLAFVSFFPQLVAGPIERASRLLPQFARRRAFDFEGACAGCRYILWGFVKKIVVADRLAVLVDRAYANPGVLSGTELAFVTACFAFQIYADFSAYSDIAIGTAKLFSIELTRNFAYPYSSQSLGEFWRRWHISLSTWFRDYVFIPLGGSRTGRSRRAFNVLATFLLSGLWHGAAWQFVWWGAGHGAAVAGAGLARGRSAAARLTPDSVPGGERLVPDPRTLVRIAVTFGVTCLAWVLFRAQTMNDAFLIVSRIAEDALSGRTYLALIDRIDRDSFMETTVIVLVVFVAIEWVQRRLPCPLEISRWPLAVRWATYTTLIWLTLDLMPQSGGHEFIYFEF